MTKQSALKHVLLVLGTIEGEHARLALEQGGSKNVSALKEITFEDLGSLAHMMSATTALPALPASACDSNMLQRRNTLLIPLRHQDQDVHQLSAWFNLTPAMFDAWREQRAKTVESTQTSPDSNSKTSAI
jgi:hypothetical protein